MRGRFPARSAIATSYRRLRSGRAAVEAAKLKRFVADLRRRFPDRSAAELAPALIHDAADASEWLNEREYEQYIADAVAAYCANVLATRLAHESGMYQAAGGRAKAKLGAHTAVQTRPQKRPARAELVDRPARLVMAAPTPASSSEARHALM